MTQRVLFKLQIDNTIQTALYDTYYTVLCVCHKKLIHFLEWLSVLNVVLYDWAFRGKTSFAHALHLIDLPLLKVSHDMKTNFSIYI